MRPSPTPSTFFAADQEWTFRVRTWDTPQSVLENGQSTEGMRLRVYQPTTEDTNWTTYANALKDVAAGTNPETAFTSSTYASPAVADGRWSGVQAYWGSGTPNWWGGSRAGRVALCYSGTLVPAARRAWLSASNSFTFALAGSGWARIDVVESGTRTTLFRGDLSETVFLASGFSYSTTRTLAADAELHIYYVQTKNEPWGGLVVKAIAGTRPSDANLEAAAAAAPVVSAGLFSYGSAVAATELPFIVGVSVTQEPGGASRAEIEVPLVNSSLHDGHGWMFYQADPANDPGALRVYDGGTLVHTLKRKRLVQIDVARKAASPSWMPIFTGHVDDFSSGSSGRLTISAVSFEGRMVEQYEQVPDRISYMGRGFRVTDYRDADPTDRKEPVYNVPAFDNWPLSWAVEELAVRSGIDPSGFRKAYEAVQANGSGQAVTLPWGAAQRVRGTSLSGELVRMPRPVHYGNVGLSFTETRPYDDEYLFKIEPTKDNWARARELTDRLGYVCRFDTTGAAVLYPTATPSFVRDLVPADATSGTVTAVTNPAAYGAKYLRVVANAAATLQATVRASRIDISFPRVANARQWTVSVAPSGGGAATVTTVSPSSASSTMELFFDGSVAAPGSNTTVYTAFTGDYGEYVVTLTAASNANLAYVDCILAYAQDPDIPKLPMLSTSDAAGVVTTRGQQDAVRNKVTIVGRRKATVTDSDKFDEAQAPTEQEFVVQNAVDVRSITDRTASNYVGYLKQAVIYDESIGDDGLARYLAQVFIYRQSVPRAGTQVTHTLLPMLEPGDPVSVQESKFDTMQSLMTQYVTKITHTLNLNKFQTTVETDAWPNYPAYQPRLDINLADFDNKPITGLSVAYTSLSGHAVNNPDVDLAKLVTGNYVEQANVTITGSTLNVNTALPWPPVPGTLQIKPNYSLSGTTRTAVQTLNTLVYGAWTPGQTVHVFPMQEDWFLYEITFATTASSSVTLSTTVQSSTVGRDAYFYYEEREGYVVVYRGTRALPAQASSVLNGTLTLKYQVSVGDARLGWLANNPYHRFVAVDYKNTPTVSRVQLPWQQLTSSTRDDSITSFGVRYRSLFPDTLRTDPNGPLVGGVSFSPFYDPYTSELGNLVSISCSILAEGLYRVSIRNWDDGTIVAWLTNPGSDPLEQEQHWEYLPVMANKQFTWDGVDQLGEWNGTQSALYAELVQGTFEEDQKPRVGRGFYCWNREIDGAAMGPLAYVWMERNADGTPIIGQGTFARWYVHVEAETTTPADNEVLSKDSDLAILTHLPEPTKLELKIEDYNTTSAQYETPATNLAADTVGAFINNTKPVRIRFKVAQRPGALWASKGSEVAVKLTREVHLRAVIGDQCVVYSGREFPDTTVEERTIYNRRLVNDEHTRQYVDTGYRKAKTFRWTDGDSAEAATEWIFYPKDFKKDFIVAGLNEAVEFGNYLQLEEVPEWSGAREVSAARSRLNFALMSYLFYLSAYVTDRSGRSSWGINRSYVDKAKIYSNTATLDWPTDPMYEQRRTIVCRQWTNETAWQTTQLSTFGYDSNTLFARLLQSFWWQHDINALTIGTGVNQAGWFLFGLPSDPYSTPHTQSPYATYDGSQYRLPTEYASRSRQLGNVVANVPTCALGQRPDGTEQTGLWNWESAPVWIPAITRDLHPFFLLPPMVSPPRPNWTGNEAYAVSDAYPGNEQDYRNQNCFWTVGGPTVRTTFRLHPYTTSTRTVSVPDAGGAETWTSPVVDYTGTNKRFWPGWSVNVKDGPFKNIVTSNVLNYVRQDEMVHYEDLRGMYSRGKFPVGQQVKVAPSAPYYLNPHKYNGFEVYDGLQKSNIMTTHMVPSRTNPTLYIDWFRTAFRSEYVWESGSMFPTKRNGAERLEGVLWWRHRFLPSTATLFYDYGAWTGWKDDLATNSGVIGGFRRSGNGTTTDPVMGNPFTTSFQPVGVGPVLPQTVELVTHLVLVPERRGSA